MPEDANQLTLADIQSGFASIGAGKVEQLPEGVSDLNPRELRFVLGVLEHGQMARAAVDAGYSTESAGAIASETLRRPKVFAFYRRCLERVATNAEQLTARVYERSVILHAKALEASQAKADAEDWLLRAVRDESGKNFKSVKEHELGRDRAQRDEKHYITLANQTDALLATLLGKIQSLTVSSTTVNVVTPEDRAHLLALQRELGAPVAAGMRGGLN